MVFLTNVSLMEFQIKYLALFHLFSLIDSFKWFWMRSLCKNKQFLKASFLVLHLPDDVICNISIDADDTTLHSE